MKKKLTYRDKLLELARIYSVREVQDYIKSKKNLTSGQLELILRKNKEQEQDQQCSNNCHHDPII